MRKSDSLKREKEVEENVNQESKYRSSKMILTVLIIFIINLFLCIFALNRITIHGESMYPTLKNNEQYFCKRVTPFTKIKRNDIIVFKAQEVDKNIKYNNPDANNSTQYIKRVIAVAGDSVKFNGKDIYVNGKKINQSYLEKHNYEDTAVSTSIEDILPTQSREWSLVSLSKMISAYNGKISWNKYSCNLTVNKVPKNCYFVLGDNRSISNDSRYYGFVPRQAIDGILLGTHSDKKGN